jgi:hypothetical protein
MRGFITRRQLQVIYRALSQDVARARLLLRKIAHCNGWSLSDD